MFHKSFTPPLTALALSAAVFSAPSAALFFAPAAAAQPECSTAVSGTSHCTTKGGSHQIVTTPPELGAPTWPGFTYLYWDYPNYLVTFP